MLPKQLKDSQRHQRQPKQVELFLQSTGGVAMLPNGKTPAMEEQIETKESKFIEFKKQEYLAQHIILLTTLM